MNTLYHYIGLVVFWLAVCAVALLAFWFVWDAPWFAFWKRRAENGWLAFKVVVLRKPFLVTRSGARVMIRLMKPGGYWKSDRWERWLAAYIIRYNRRVGYLPD